MLLSQYEFLYNSLVIKLVTQVSLVFMQLSVMGAASEVILHRESKKTKHQTLSHNFINYYPIFKFFSLADSVVNLQQIHV